MDRFKNITMDSSLVLKNTSKKLADRPVERIRFATPQAERRYKRILKQLEQDTGKSCRSKSLVQIPSSLLHTSDDTSCLNSNKKRTISSENSAESSRKKRRILVGKKFEDPFIADLGPIPSENSDIFANMSFVLCHASDSGQCVSRTHECKENAGEWRDQPFYSEDRLIVQLNAGGGKVFQSFKLVPPEEHKRTKLITNAPSLHPQRILCLKAGIPAYSHRWVIRCCQQNKTLDPSQDEIPALERVLENGCITCCQR